MKEINIRLIHPLLSIVILIVFTFITLTEPVAAFAAESANETSPGAEASANSWRYHNGDLSAEPEKSDSAFFSRASFVPWSKNDDGQFINSEGTVIKDAVKKGIDVSYFQGEINWKKVKASGIDFAILRCGYAENLKKYDDSTFAQNASECERLGIPYGVYFYSYANTLAEAEDEAEHALRLLKGHTPDYPVYYDLEDEEVAAAGRSTIIKIADTFCSQIEYNGYKAGIYANLNWWNTKLNSSSLNKYEKWVAQYNKQCTYKDSYRIWQCTSTGRVPGIEGRVDLNFELQKDDTDTFMDNVGVDIVAPITDIADYPAVVTAPSLIFRTGPGAGYPKAGSLPEDTCITITRTAHGWGEMSDGYWINLAYTEKYRGSWIKNEDGQTVFEKADGTIASSQWVQYKGNNYYVDKNGKKVTGLRTINGTRYYFSSAGIAPSNKWISVSGRKYYVRSKGKLAVGYTKVGDYYYGFSPSGVMMTGTKIINNKKYYFYPSGKARLCKVKTKTDLNYRTGPGTKYRKRGTYKKNKIIPIIRKQNGWGKTSSGYWIRLSYTSKVISYPQTLPTASSYWAKTTSSVTYRTGSAKSYRKKGTYKRGTILIIRTTKNGWGKMNNGYWVKLTSTKKI